MRIAFLSAVYTPEREPAAVMAAQLAERWIRDGHQVDVYCPFPNRPEGTIRRGWKRQAWQVESCGKLRVVRCWHWLVGGKRSIGNRLLENLTFGCSSALQALWRGKPDTLVISTWPFAAAGVAILLARLWRIPAIYYVQDLYPEAAVEAGLLRRGSWVTGALVRLDRWYCASSARIILVSESMRELFLRNRPGLGARVAVIGNWLEADEIKPMGGGDLWREEHDIPTQSFLAMFAGNLGNVSGAGVLVRVARHLRDRPDTCLICVGEGVLKNSMAAEAARQGLTNLRFLPFQARDRIALMQSAADVLILTMRPGSGAASVPSKLITYLAAGRAVVCAAPADSECHAIIRRSGAGVNVPPGDAGSIADALIALSANRDELERMAGRARRYFMEHFTADRALREMGQLLFSIHVNT